MASTRKACLLGGSGFLGSRLASRLAAAGWELVIPTRTRSRARRLLVLPTARVVETDIRNPAALARVIDGCDAVVNLVGILNEKGRSGAGFRQAHTELARQLVQTCSRPPVKRLIQVSALRADAQTGPSHYLRTKGEAERLLRESSGLDWVILQPSVIFGPGDSFTNRFARLLGRIPLVFPLAMSTARFAPVHVDDVVAAIAHCLESPATTGHVYQLCGPQVLSLGQIVQRIAQARGLRRAIWGLPRPLSRWQARLMDFVPGKPFSTDNFLSLTVDSVCTEDGFAALGLRPRSLDAHLADALGDSLSRARRDSARRRHARSGG